MLHDIFRNPRVHTGGGYYEKRQAINPWNFPLRFGIGDRVHVTGFADATVVSDRQTSGDFAGKIKIRYDDGQFLSC